MTETKTTKKAKRSYVTEDSKEMFEVHLPINDGESGDEVVIVNDRRYIVARGKRVKVPAWVAEALKHKEKMTLLEHEYRMKNQNRLNQF